MTIPTLCQPPVVYIRRAVKESGNVLVVHLSGLNLQAEFVPIEALVHESPSGA